MFWGSRYFRQFSGVVWESARTNMERASGNSCSALQGKRILGHEPCHTNQPYSQGMGLNLLNLLDFPVMPVPELFNEEGT